jgi:hypothetical protein
MLNDTLQKTYGGTEANIRTFSASTLVRYDSYIHSMLALISKKKKSYRYSISDQVDPWTPSMKSQIIYLLS